MLNGRRWNNSNALFCSRIFSFSSSQFASCLSEMNSKKEIMFELFFISFAMRFKVSKRTKKSSSSTFYWFRLNNFPYLKISHFVLNQSPYRIPVAFSNSKKLLLLSAWKAHIIKFIEEKKSRHAARRWRIPRKQIKKWVFSLPRKEVEGLQTWRAIANRKHAIMKLNRNK